MLFDDLTESAKENAVQAFSDYFDDEVSQRMLESIGNLEATRFIDVDVSKDADGTFSLDAEKRKTPCFADGNDVPPKPERLKQTDDTVDQLFCEEYNKAVRILASSWNEIQGAMKRHPDALAALKTDDRFMTAWEEDMSDYGDALDAATDDDAEFARLGKEFKAMNSDVEDAVDDFADDDLKATQDALDRVAEVLSEESERYRTQDGVSKLSQEMGVDFDEDGEPTNLFEKTSSKSGDVEYALTRRIPAPVEMQEDTGVCPLCHSDAFDGRYCPVCGFHRDREDDGEEADGKAGTLAYMLKIGTRKTAQGYDEDDKTYSITELDQQTRGEVVDRERKEMYSTSLLSNLLSEDWDSLNNFCDGVGIEYKSSGYSEYDWVRCVEDTGECHAKTASDMLNMDIYEAENDGYPVGVGMAERYNNGLKEVIALQKKAIAIADSPEMDRLEDMGLFDGGDDRIDAIDLICRIAYLGYTEDASSFSDAVDRYKYTLSVDGMNDDDVEAAMTLCDRLNGQMNEILDEYNETYQSVCQEALDSGIQSIVDNEGHLTSYKGIVESLEENDARFTSDGTRVAARRHSSMRAPKTRRGNNMRASQMRKRNRTGSFKGAWSQKSDCDQVDEAISIIEFNAPYRDHSALADFVKSTMNDECSSRSGVLALAEHYGVLPDSKRLIDRFWDQFYNEVWSNIDEDELLKNGYDWSKSDSSIAVSSACGRGRKRNRKVR